MDKQAIRKELLKIREKQPRSLKSKKDKKILHTLMKLPLFAKSHEFFSYMSHRGEVSTDFLLTKFLGVKKIIVPKIKGKGICLFELKNVSQFEKGRFAIREPISCLPLPELKQIEVALIPGVAFDKTGHRIGFGKGYFDRLLKKIHSTTIGLAYEFQIIDKVPRHSYDVPVDYIVTEKRIIRCKS